MAVAINANKLIFMKNVILIFLLNLLVSTSLFAQTFVGLKAGGALSGNTSGGIGLGGSAFAKPTYLGGFFISVPLTDNLRVQPEVLYVNKGNQSRIVPRRSFTPRYNLHYINLPIILQYHVLNRLMVELGPEFGYLLSAGTNLNASGSIVSFSPPPEFPSFHEQLLSSFRDFDIAINLGMGYVLSDRWSLNLRYNLGLYDISDDFEVSFRKIGDPNGEVESILFSGTRYNRSAQISVGYRIF